MGRSGVLSDLAPFTVHVTADAAQRVRARGGRLFLWNRPVGRIGSRDYVATAAPLNLDYTCFTYPKRNVQIRVPMDFEFNDVIVRARRWPFSGVRVHVNGKRWGWRGGAIDTPAG